MQRETKSCRPVYNSWQPEVCWKSVFIQSGSVFVFYLPEIILLFSAKQNIQVINILE